MTFNGDNTAAANALAAKLAQAYRLGTSLPLAEFAATGLMPATIEAGALAQAAAVRLIGRDVTCWKVAINPDRIPVSAPILDLYVAGKDGQVEVNRAGAKGMELEVCFRLSDDVPVPDPARPLTRADLLTRIGAIHFGVELLGFRIAEEDKAPFPLFLADRLGNHSFVLGPQIEQADFDRIAAQDASILDVTVQNHDDILFAGKPKHPLGDPLKPMLAYANSPMDKLGGLRRGQVVTTGSVCGLIKFAREADITISGGPPLPMRISVSPP